MDCGGQPRSALGVAALLGPGVEERGKRHAAAVRFVPRVHGTGSRSARRAPCSGGCTAQIHLQPFGYLEAARFHPRWSPEDRAKAYFLVGGLPQYLLCLDDARSIGRNVRGNLIDEFAPLFHEPTFLLREELREVAPYHAVLFAARLRPRSSSAGHRRRHELPVSGTCPTTCSNS